MLGVAACILLWGRHHVAVVSAGGAFQSGPNSGALYAGGLDFDVSSNEVLITGITYDDNTDTPTEACSCFIANLDGRYLQNQGFEAARLGNGQTVEMCSSISVLDELRFVVGGNSDPGGLYGSFDAPNGFVVAMTQNDFSVITGAQLDSSQTSYPMKIIADDWHDAVYVASVTSNNLDLGPNYHTLVNANPEPNWLRYRKYGSSFEMAVHKLNYMQDTLVSASTKPFPVQVDADGNTPDVYLGGMIYKVLNEDLDLLIVAGSTRGLGEGYGDAAGDDEDGFITVIDPLTGELVANGQKTNERIGTAEDDIIGGICDDKNDKNAFYVVGATKGQMDGTTASTSEETIPQGSLKAFVMKVQLDTLEAIWTVQWGAVDQTSDELTFALGLQCLVVDNVVYVAGTVDKGASIAEGLSHAASRGGDDIWVAQLAGDSGSVNWIHQLGTEGDEYLARGGGLGLDEESNLIVYGDTSGSFYRVRDPSETTNDIFLFTMNQVDGSYPDIGAAQSPVAAPTGPTPTEDAPSQPMPTPGSSDSTVALSGDFGVQSGPSAGPLFAGGMVYDANQDEVFLTGLTYDPNFEGPGSISDESSCFVAAVVLVDGRVEDWQGDTVFGDPLVLESCHSLTLHRYNELVVVGSVDQSSKLIPTSSNAGIMSGMALGVNRDDLSRIDSTSLVTTEPTERFEYPVSVVSDGDDLYIVALTSTDSVPSNEYIAIDPVGSSSLSINWIEIQKYGTTFDMTVTKLTLSETKIDGVEEGVKFLTKWSKEFPIDVDDQTGTVPRVYIGGAIVKKDLGYLAVVGSTRGLGVGYGEAIGDDEDGFITLLDLQTGELATNVARSSMREGSEEDDRVTGICHDPTDMSSFYVTGETYGDVGVSQSNLSIPKGSLQAFLRKVDANSLDEIWSIRWGALQANSEVLGFVFARDCAVFGSFVYVGGVVENSAGIVQGDDVRQTQGGDDIWVAQVSSVDAQVNWLHQVGSSGQDHMARHGGLIATAAGHAIVFGDTTGPVYRERVPSELNDLIVMTFDSSDGSHGDAFMTQVPTPSPGGAPVALEPTAAAPTALAPTPLALQPVTLGTDTSNDSNSVNDNNSDSTGLSAGAIFGLVIGLFLILGVVTWWWCRRRRGYSGKSVDDMTNIDFEVKAKRDGLFASNGRGSSNGEKDSSEPSWSSASQRGGLGGFLYTEEPTLGGPNLQGGGYSDLKNKGKEVI